MSKEQRDPATHRVAQKSKRTSYWVERGEINFKVGGGCIGICIRMPIKYSQKRRNVVQKVIVRTYEALVPLRIPVSMKVEGSEMITHSLSKRCR